MTEKAPTLREQNKMTVRRELARAGMELFLTKGFAQTTIEEIVEKMGVARRTFFRYFKTKEELVFAWHGDKTPALVEALKARPKNERPLTAICATLSSLLDRYDANPQGAMAMIRLLKETPTLLAREFEKRMVWEQALAAALVEREGKKAMPLLKARILVGTALTAWTAGIDEWYAAEGKGNLRRIMEKAFSLAIER